MAADKPEEIEAPALKLKHCSVEEHARGLLALKRLPFWWHQGVHPLFGNYSLPFRDESGNWWYQVKPGLSWPVDLLGAIARESARPPYMKTFLGYQHVVPDEAAADSRLVINAILDLAAYGAGQVSHNRRKMVRKGFKRCTLEVLKSFEEQAVRQCHRAWNDLTTRTGWRKPVEWALFEETWRMVFDCPGLSVIAGRDKESGEIAGFLITKIVGDTAHGDTIASRTDLLGTNVNDAVVYAFLKNAARLPGVRKANYAIKSYVTKLEQFKEGIGFKPHPFPARTCLRPGVGLALRLVFPKKYNRMIGRFEEGPAQAEGEGEV